MNSLNPHTAHRLKEGILKVITFLLQRNPGQPVLSEEWGQLVILDDCRYDTLREEYLKRNLPGKLESRLSLGSWTGEFLVRNFHGKYEDIVFVTANPFVDLYLKDRFHAIISVWKTRWNERYRTVLPADVYRAALEAAKRYPDNRLVIHFLQPHHPYLPLKSQDRTMELIKDSVSGGRLKMDRIENEPLNKLYLSPIYGRFHIRRLIWAYRENLRVVIPYVELLLHKLKGKTIVTADHGELFGERVTRLIPIEVYGHGIGRNPNLIKVPWWVIDDEDREKLRPIKEIMKEIKKIEIAYNLPPLRTHRKEDKKLKNAILRLKLAGKI